MIEGQTVYFKPQPPKPATLLVIDKKHAPKLIPLKGDTTIGRDYPEADCDLRLDSCIVSRHHGEFIFDDSDGSYYYIDNNSYNGTFINGRKLEPYNQRGSRAYKLTDGDIIRIDKSDLNDPHKEAVLMIFSTSFSKDEKWYLFDLTGRNSLTIGRDPSCSLTLSDLMASSVHAVMQRYNYGWVIIDNNSTNGIGFNGHEIENSERVHDHDVIRIANSTLIVIGDKIIYNFGKQSKGALSIDIREKTVRNRSGSGTVTLLKDIKADFESGDFALILGGSGAGKTTLIKAILGESKADGKIILDGQDLYKNFKNMKHQVGMVPQFLTLRKNDTVRNTLLDIAKMSLGRMYSKAEINARVDEVIDLVGITEHQHKLIGQLSGGQQKKASVASQLIGFQKVFIFDEPDSGLDGGSREQQMSILKDISLRDKIVMVISHQPDDAVSIDKTGKRYNLFTKVLVIAKSSFDGAGHLAYFGGVENALHYFGVERLQDIMIEINPVTEGGRGRADYYIERFRQNAGRI